MCSAEATPWLVIGNVPPSNRGPGNIDVSLGQC